MTGIAVGMPRPNLKLATRVLHNVMCLHIRQQFCATFFNLMQQFYAQILCQEKHNFSFFPYGGRGFFPSGGRRIFYFILYQILSWYHRYAHND